MRPEALLTAVIRGLQNRVDWHTRDSLARALAGVVCQEAPRLEARADADLLRALKQRGLCNAPLTISQEQCRDVVAYFSATKCYAAHVPAYSDGVARTTAEAAQLSPYGSYRLEDSLAAPHLLGLALHPQVLALAAAYLGCLPSLYSVNTFWTFPSTKPGVSHGFHRDEDDYRFLVVFIYWTDVEPGEGEFYFMEGTHDADVVTLRLQQTSLLRRLISLRPFVRIGSADDLRRLNGGNGYGYDVLYRRIFGDQARCVAGPPGTAIAADTFALHRGTPPRSRARLVTWIRYGLYENDAYETDGTRPLPASRLAERPRDDAVARYVSRLVIDWDG